MKTLKEIIFFMGIMGLLMLAIGTQTVLVYLAQHPEVRMLLFGK